MAKLSWILLVKRALATTLFMSIMFRTGHDEVLRLERAATQVLELLPTDLAASLKRGTPYITHNIIILITGTLNINMLPLISETLICDNGGHGPLSLISIF